MEESDILLIRIFEGKKFIKPDAISSLDTCTSEIFQQILIGFLKINGKDVEALEKATFHQKFKVASKISDMLKEFGIKCAVTAIVAPSGKDIRVICSQIVGKLPEEKSKLENFESFEDLQSRQRTEQRKLAIEEWQSRPWIHPLILDKPAEKKRGFPFVMGKNIPLRAIAQSHQSISLISRLMNLMNSVQGNQEGMNKNKGSSHYLIAEENLGNSDCKDKLLIGSSEWKQLKEENSRQKTMTKALNSLSFEQRDSETLIQKEEEEENENFLKEKQEKELKEKEKIESMRENFESNKDELISLQTNSKQKEFEIAEMESMLSSLKTELMELNKTATSKMSEINALSDDSQSQNLTKEVNSLANEVSKIEETVESATTDLNDKISHTKRALEKLDEEEESKKLKLKELSSEIDSMHYELRNGEQLIERLKDEWENIPKEISRSVFVKKIKDIQGNLGKQRHIITQAQNDLENVSSRVKLNENMLNRTYIEFENLMISKDPKRSDLLFSRIFTVYNEFKFAYAKTISNLEVQEKLKKELQSLEIQVEILKTKKFDEKLEQLRAEIMQM